MNSLLNQQEICHGFAEQHGYTIVGQSFDDNVSGMKFNRHGLDELTAAVDAGKINAVIVKDLSRLGRHRTQTALFIDYLREHQVRVISATEGIDTFCDEDDLIIGIRGLMNDYYARDISKKIRAGYRQKQREGIVIHRPLAIGKIETPIQSNFTRRHRKPYKSSILCTYRGLVKKKFPAGSMRWDERRRHNSGRSNAAKKSVRQAKPVMGAMCGRMPA